MKFSPDFTILNNRIPLLIIIFLSSFFPYDTVLAGCHTSIISFGDSITDTGNGMYLEHNQLYQHLPYGESFIYGPTGRCSNGLLIIDFMAQAMGLPLVPPYNMGHSKQDFRLGVNFAMAGAAALDATFFHERGVEIHTNYTLSVQMDWFRQLLPSLCKSGSNCRNLFQNALFLVGTIGGNDYDRLLMYNTSVQEIRTYVPLIVAKISPVIRAAINEGAVTLVVPGIFPAGCYPYYLTRYLTPDINKYDAYGCLKWLNEIFQFHNRLLQVELGRLREMYPHVTIMYADYYNVAMELFRIPEQLGFRAEANVACCGGGGPYNYNPALLCGDQQCSVCGNVSEYVCWDTTHLTEAGYKWVTTGLLERSFIIPPLDISCGSSYKNGSY